MPNNSLPLVTGDDIRRLRNMKGLKQNDAGKKLGIGQQAYSKIECSTDISELKLLQILAAFESSREELDIIKKFTPPLKKSILGNLSCTKFLLL